MFCGCNVQYNPDVEVGTMFQCIGLPGGCGEDWWHPECIVGVARDWYKSKPAESDKPTVNEVMGTGEVQGAGNSVPGEADQITPDTAPEGAAKVKEEIDSDPPLPPTFPDEDAFESLICYVCLDANPWLKQYAHMGGKVLPPVFHRSSGEIESSAPGDLGAVRKRKGDESLGENAPPADTEMGEGPTAKRQKMGCGEETRLKEQSESAMNRACPSVSVDVVASGPEPTCRLLTLPPAPEGRFSLFLADSFREALCRCETCLPKLSIIPGLLEEEETYEPPLSEDGSTAGDGGGGGSLYDRGEAALNTVDRVRAIGELCLPTFFFILSRID